MTLALRVKRLSPRAVLPRYLTEGSAGLDLVAAFESAVAVSPGERLLVPTGLSLAIPPGYEGQVRPRSGLAARHGITVINAPGTIDADYRGEVMVALINHGREPFVIEPGMRVAQLVVSPVARVEVEPVEELEATDRGGGGFGHTGV